MEKLVAQLEQIAQLAKKSTGAEELRAAIHGARENSREFHQEQLENELATWESKLGVIMNEPAGREGMAKHARHWAQKLKRG